jgi:hypothetical protein
MKHIALGINLTHELGIKSVTIDYNDTDLPSDSKLINLIAFALLKSIHINNEDLDLQDTLNEVGIKLSEKLEVNTAFRNPEEKRDL